MLKSRPPREQRERRVRREARSADRRALDEAARALRSGSSAGPDAAPEPPPVAAPVRRRPELERASARPAVTSSTARQAGATLEKSGDVLAPSYLAWVRGQTCAFCGAKPPTEAHHFPTKGSLGMTVDLLVTPACRDCHGKAHAGAISRATQQGAVVVALTTFLRRAPRSLKRDVFAEIARGLEPEEHR